MNNDIPVGKINFSGSKKIFSAVSAAVLSLSGLFGAFASPSLALAQPASINVTIVKYVDGQPATAQNVNNATFSMHVKYTGGEGDYLLGPTGVNTASPYQIMESLPSGTNNFDAYENIYGAVGPSCASKLPYVLSGYTMGSSLAAAASSVPTTTSPSLATLTSDMFVIVWNRRECYGR